MVWLWNRSSSAGSVSSSGTMMGAPTLATYPPPGWATRMGILAMRLPSMSAASPKSTPWHGSPNSMVALKLAGGSA